jgi:predicted DCC family thiol-disulfide oxidoreductase YuxK
MENESARPIMIFDGNCGFCGIWIDYWKRLTGDRILYERYQEAAVRFPQIPRENFQGAVHLILPDGAALSGARAVFRSLADVPDYAWMLWAQNKIPGFEAVSERLYRIIARHRSLAYHVTTFLWGKRIEPPSFQIASHRFLQALGFIYLMAFLSLATQITGLIGTRGVLPCGPFLQAVAESLGPAAWLRVPTIFWLGSSDLILKLACIAGSIASFAVTLNIGRRIALVVAWLLYLSLASAGQSFLSFQWDFLLLEAGFLAMFLKPFFARVWLFRWLLFRLLFLSGAVKLLSGDPAWRNLTALQYHYETQPLPTPFAWYFHQMPAGFQKASVVFVFFVELVVPFLMFAPRRVRFFAGGMAVALQTLIFIAGNYAFFNLLTVALCLFLYDDAFLRRFERREPKPVAAPTGFQRAVTASLFPVILLAGCFLLQETLSNTMPAPAATALSWMAPFGIVNTYGLFAVMTTTRPEIIVEGSNDGETWLEYRFRYKPGDLRRVPAWVQPHQPRLDWQAWFAALGDPQQRRWFENFLARLLQGSPEVLALLAGNPFPEKPPRYVRALLYDYRFTNSAKRRATGNWWRRELKGTYFRPASLAAAQP